MLKKLSTPVFVFVIFILSLGIVSAQDNLAHVPPQYTNAPDCLMESPEGTVEWEDANIFYCTDLGTYEDIRYNLSENQVHDIQVVKSNMYDQVTAEDNKSLLIWGCGWSAAHRTNEQSQITTVEGAIYQAWLCYWMYAGGEFPGVSEYEVRADGSVGIINDDDDDSDDEENESDWCISGPYVDFNVRADGYLESAQVNCLYGATVSGTHYNLNGTSLYRGSSYISGYALIYLNGSYQSIVGFEITVEKDGEVYEFSWGARG